MWGYFYEKKAADNINILLKKINDQSLKDGIQYISMFDELNADGNGSDFSKALDKVMRPLVLMGVNPASSRSPAELDFQEPDNPSTSSFRLKTKHRNTFQIAVLLIHYNHSYQKECLGKADHPYKCLDTVDDCQLDIKQLTQGPVPIWIKQHQTMPDTDLLHYIKTNILDEDESVTLLHSPNTTMSSDMAIFCCNQKWNIATFWSIIGCEDEVIISIIENNYSVQETLSRARKKLVIVTRYYL